MATVTSVSDRIAGGPSAAIGGTGVAGKSLRLALLVGLGGSILWQAAFAGQFLSGHAGALKFHEYGAYVVVILGIASLIVEIVSGSRRHRWGTVWVAGLLATAIIAQLLLGFMSLSNAQSLAYHVPLGVSIAGLYVYYLTLGVRHLREAPPATA